MHLFIKRIAFIVVHDLNKIQEKRFNFKAKVQEPAFQMKYQQKEIVMLSL